jgi:hypothetical protein
MLAPGDARSDLPQVRGGGLCNVCAQAECSVPWLLLQRTWASDGSAFSWPTRARTYGRLCYAPGVAGVARCAGGA